MACFDLASGPKKRPQRGGRAHQKIDRTGRPSITKTERPRSANLPQMPRGLMCKLRRRGPDYGGPAGSRGIDPSLQPLPFAAIAGAVLYGRAASRRPSHAFRLNPNSGPVCPACDIGVALFGGLFCICEWPFRPVPGAVAFDFGDWPLLISGTRPGRFWFTSGAPKTGCYHVDASHVGNRSRIDPDNRRTWPVPACRIEAGRRSDGHAPS